MQNHLGSTNSLYVSPPVPTTGGGFKAEAWTSGLPTTTLPSTKGGRPQSAAVHQLKNQFGAKRNSVPK
jgi:hypothetical protein